MAAHKFLDGEGSSLTLAAHAWKGVTHYMPEHWGHNLGHVLTEADDFNWRKDDVWICSYPKSGDILFITSLVYNVYNSRGYILLTIL